jgi:hypothetical protein
MISLLLSLFTKAASNGLRYSESRPWRFEESSSGFRLRTIYSFDGGTDRNLLISTGERYLISSPNAVFAFSISTDQVLTTLGEEGALTTLPASDYFQFMVRAYNNCLLPTRFSAGTMYFYTADQIPSDPESYIAVLCY